MDTPQPRRSSAHLTHLTDWCQNLTVLAWGFLNGNLVALVENPNGSYTARWVLKCGLTHHDLYPALHLPAAVDRLDALLDAGGVVENREAITLLRSRAEVDCIGQMLKERREALAGIGGIR